MDISLIILAGIAVLVITRLYSVLGQKTGAEPARRFDKPAARKSEREPEPQPETEDKPKLRAAFTGPAAGELEAIAAVDADFNPEDFTKGARKAYELIVNAFADGDRDALKQLVDDDVFEAYAAAITEREKTGAEPMRLARLKTARIAGASIDATQMARVQVSFEAELSDGDRVRGAREIWTFKRQLNSNSPNWLLDEVATAS